MPYTPPRLLRRYAAALYDILLLVALWMIAMFVALPLFSSDKQPMPVAVEQIYLAIVAFIFFGWFWTHGGQTLGMRVWRVKLITGTGQQPGWYQALVRYLSMLIPWAFVGLGLELFNYASTTHDPLYAQFLAPLAFVVAIVGFVWPLFDRHHLAWHDRLSQSGLTVVPRPSTRRRAASAQSGENNQTGESQ